MSSKAMKLRELIEEAKELAGKLERSREASMVITKLDEARLWLNEYPHD